MSETITQYLLTRHYSVESAVNLKFSYSVGEPKLVTVRLGDEVTAKYVDAAGNLKIVNGIITDIINKRVSNGGNGASFRANEQMGNGNYELQFKIDASTSNNAKVVSIYLIDLYDIVLGSIPDQYTVTATVTEGLIDKPSQNINSGESATVKFTPNTDKVLKALNVGTDSYIYDAATDTFTPDIAAGTTVTVTSTLITVSIDAVTADTAIAAVFGDPTVVPTTYTVTASAVKGTVDNDTQTVVEGANATITVTGDTNTELSKITIDSVEYVYDGTDFTPALPTEITFVNDILTITNVSADMVVAFTFDDIVIPTPKYFVTASATSATVDIDSQEIEEGSQAVINVTPDADAVLESITIDGTVYTDLNNLPSGMTFNTNVFTIASVTAPVNVVFTYTIPVVPTTYTVTASATNAAVDNATQAVNENDSVTINVTPDENTVLTNITIDDVEYTDVATLPTGITFESNVFTIATVTADMTVVFNYDIVTPVTTYTVNTTAVKATVDNESLTVNEGDDSIVVITPDAGTEFKSTTIDSVEYVYDADATTFTPELPGNITITVAATITFAIDDVAADHTANFIFDDIPAVRHTVTASAVKGTVDNATQDIVEGTSATINVTPDVDTVLKKVSYKNGEDEAVEYVYDADTQQFTPALDQNINVIVTSTVAVEIAAVNNDITIEVTLEDLPSNLSGGGSDTGSNTNGGSGGDSNGSGNGGNTSGSDSGNNSYLITASATNGIVNKSSSTEVEGTDISVIATPDTDYELDKITINSVEYVYDGSNFAPELPTGITVDVDSVVTVTIDDIANNYNVSFDFKSTN